MANGCSSSIGKTTRLCGHARRWRYERRLIVSVPSEWNGADVAILEAELRCDFSELLPPGTVIMVIREPSRVFVRHRPEPLGTAALRQMPPATKAVN